MPKISQTLRLKSPGSGNAMMPSLPLRLLKGLSFAIVIAGAAGVVFGCVGPWAQVVAFKNIDISVPGFFFPGGGLCLAVAALVLVGARRSPLLCLIGSLFVLAWVQTARHDLPMRVKHQVIGAQMAFFPINRLLDQFHIPDVTVADWNVPNDQLLGPGLTWTMQGGWLLLLGGALGLPADPVAVWVYARAARARCRACGARWRQSREAAFCPDCGTPTSTRPRCPSCGTTTRKSDTFCVACGTALATETTEICR